jgi:glycosyltransferase involved in cell wall biosynthesis
MKYANVFYVPHFNIIGGIETYCYELAKKYKDKDITFVYSDLKSDINQLNRIRKYARVIYQPYNSKEPIKCKRLFVMYRSKIDLFEPDDVIQIIHADYEAQNLKPNLDERISKRYGVSKAVADSYNRISGINVDVCYNPLTIDKPKKVLKLISATRLTKEKGKDRMIKLADALDKAGIPYLWLIFTNDSLPIPNKNVIYMQPRLDIRDFIADADYLVQLSDTEAFSYSVLESLCLNTPVITTNIPSFKEMGVKTGINGYILDFSMNEIPINDIYTKIPKFTFKMPKDKYDELLINEPSTYTPDKLVKVICKRSYKDLEFNRKIQKDEEIEITLERAEYLKGLGLVW